MDHKPWLWRKKSSEKAVVSGDDVNYPGKGNPEMIQTLTIQKAGLEKNLKCLNDKLSWALSECITKDEIIKKNTKIVQEAIAGWEKAQEEACALKQELDESVWKIHDGDERIARLDSALKECIGQLQFVREEQEERIHDAVMKTSSEFKKCRTVLEEGLTESGKRLSKMGTESTQLSKALLTKDKIIKDLQTQLTEIDADFNALLSRLESTEKNNASLKYEVTVLEKEVKIRKEEREFNRRSAESSHKQHLESVKRIADLESETQRLRILVRKRLPGPAALAEMKNEVEILGKDSSGVRRRQSTPAGFVGCSAFDYPPKIPDKGITVLTKKYSKLEEQNRILKEALDKKTNELQYSQIMRTHTISSLTSHELAGALISDISSDDNMSTAESWASPLMPEFQHFRNGKGKSPLACKIAGSSLDLNLMNDFAEMERLSIVSVNTPVGNSQISLYEVSDLEQNQVLWTNLYKKPDHEQVAFTEKEIRDVPTNLRECLRKLIELVEGIRFSSPDYKSSNSSKMDSNSISEMPTGYTIRVFLWKTSEMSVVLEQFLCSCQQMMNGKASCEKFVEELTTCLEWIINHCFSHQDVSSMKDSIKTRFDWEESRSESEVEKSLNPIEKLSCFSMAAPPTNLNVRSEEEHAVKKEENNKLREEVIAIECAKQHFEGRLQSAAERSELLSNKLQKSENMVVTLQKELDTLQESNVIIVDKTENPTQDVDDQLTTITLQRNKVKHDNKHHSWTTLLESSLQRESKGEKQSPKNYSFQDEKDLRTDREITAASEKLAECQETILNLGKQLKVLAATKETTLLNKAATPPSDLFPIATNVETENVTPQEDNGSIHRFSLLDRMAEDDARTKHMFTKHTKMGGQVNGLENQVENEIASSWAVVPTKNKNRGSLSRKLLWGEKKAKSLKKPIPFTK